jgi:hypothetical protein
MPHLDPEGTAVFAAQGMGCIAPRSVKLPSSMPSSTRTVARRRALTGTPDLAGRLVPVVLLDDERWPGKAAVFRERAWTGSTPPGMRRREVLAAQAAIVMVGQTHSDAFGVDFQVLQAD